MQTRDYIYVDDVIDALMLGFALASGTYNVGTGVETKLLDVLDIINKLTRARPSARFQPPKANEIKRSAADITKLRSIGWRPKVSIEEGISRLLGSEVKT
jgi:UDP-glucose 4-epimerase